MPTIENDTHQKSNGTKAESPMTYIFFDFEFRQDDQIQCDLGFQPDAKNKCSNCRKSTCGTFAHVPNLCVVQKVCENCLDKPINGTSRCKSCGLKERVFAGDNTTTLFCKWLFSEENVGATVICHNFKGYDSYPILNYLHQSAILPDLIMSGSKYMSIEVSVCKL